jgi:hypothetical protein
MQKAKVGLFFATANCLLLTANCLLHSKEAGWKGLLAGME